MTAREKYQSLSGLILKASSQYKRALLSLLEPYRLSVPQLNALRLLHETNAAVSIEFVKANLAPCTLDVSRMVDDLHEKDFIVKIKSVTDGRCYQISLSLNGKSALRKIERRSFESRLLGRLQEVEIEQLQRSLMKIAATTEPLQK